MDYVARGTRNPRFFLLVLCFLLIRPVSAQPAKVRVTLRETVQVHQAQIELGDIAQIEAPEHLRESLRQISIANAPLPGKRRTIHLSHVRTRLIQSKLISIEQIQLEGTNVQVERNASPVLPPEHILAEANAYLRRATGQTALSLQSVGTIPPISLTSDKTQLNFRLLSADADLGRFSLEMQITDDGRPVAHRILQLRADSAIQEHVARRDLPINHTLTPEDVRPADAGLIGKRLRRAVRRGEAIHPADLAEVWLVNQGEPVALVVQIGALRVSTEARALQAGAYGQTIRVQNLNSKMEQLATVIGERQVALMRASAANVSLRNGTSR